MTPADDLERLLAEGPLRCWECANVKAPLNHVTVCPARHVPAVAEFVRAREAADRQHIQFLQDKFDDMHDQRFAEARKCDALSAELTALRAEVERLTAQGVLLKSVVGNSDRMAAEITALRAVRDASKQARMTNTDDAIEALDAAIAAADSGRPPASAGPTQRATTGG